MRLLLDQGLPRSTVHHLMLRIEGQRAEGLATLLVNVLKVARTIWSKEL
jgi:hypothetical protein